MAKSIGQFYQYTISEIQNPLEGLPIPIHVSQAVPYLQCFMMVFTSPNLLLLLSLKTKPITQNPAVPLPHQTLSVFNLIKSPTAVIDRKKKKPWKICGTLQEPKPYSDFSRTIEARCLLNWPILTNGVMITIMHWGNFISAQHHIVFVSQPNKLFVPTARCWFRPN